MIRYLCAKGMQNKHNGHPSYLHALWTEMVDGLVFGTFQLPRSLLPDICRWLLLLPLRRVGERPGAKKMWETDESWEKNLCRCKLSVSTPGFLPHPLLLGIALFHRTWC